MNSRLLSCYHQLPRGGRFLAATLYGLWLNRWRYGRDTEQMVSEAIERERWRTEEWERWRALRLPFVLERAATRVPHYRQLWAERRRRGDDSSWRVLGNWPVLEKETVRADPMSFVADDCDRKQMYREQTSGTTGTPLTLWWSRATLQVWYALFEARWRRWYGVSKEHRWGMIGGQPVVPARSKRPPFWVWNAPMKQLYLSAYHFSQDSLPHYLEALKQYRVAYLYGYPSLLSVLAQEMLRLGRRDLKMKVVIANAEPIFDDQKRAIREAFQCPVRETYGMAEIVAAAGECEGGRLHLWPEVGLVEVVQDGRLIASGESGDLICTGLLNSDMPLVRYRVGDSGRLASQEATCSCGRNLPVLASIEGRRDDVLYTKDGRLVGRLDPVFKSDLNIREAQIVQEAFGRLKIRYVPTSAFGFKDAQEMKRRLEERMGSVEVVFEKVDQVPREANGKFRSVVSRLSREERPVLMNRA